MTNYLVNRLFGALLTVWVTTLAVCFLIHLVPGDPVQIMYAQSATTTPEQLDLIRHNLGLDRSIIHQYIIYMSNLLHGDFGTTIRGQQPVLDLILLRLPYTLWLTITALIISLIIGGVAGFFAAYKQGQWLDRFLMSSTIIGISIPPFWLGLMLLAFFSVNLGWFPVAGDGWLSLILPATTLAACQAATIGRIVRSTMIDIFDQDYIRTAYAKGLSKPRVLGRHALRSGMVPIISILGMQFAYMMGGAIVVEYIFSWNGLGRLAIQAIFQRDYPLIQGFILTFSIIVVLVSVLMDVLYAALDPRISRK
ncbi:MAG: peptide/nickel transport system permease protein [Paraglaciecola sp.]|jgi:peptide/nickel transport system permease protein|tara:strand:- start:2634 stop:3557 length:924 start_codon:yes stop_codon:yes gene_type:complete